VVLPDPRSRRAGPGGPGLHPQPGGAAPPRPEEPLSSQPRPGPSGRRAGPGRCGPHASPRHRTRRGDRPPGGPVSRMVGPQRPRLRRTGGAGPGRYRAGKLPLPGRPGHRRPRLGAGPLRGPDGRHCLAVAADRAGHLHPLSRPDPGVRGAVRPPRRPGPGLVLPAVRRDPAPGRQPGRGRGGHRGGRGAGWQRGPRSRQPSHLRDAPPPSDPGGPGPGGRHRGRERAAAGARRPGGPPGCLRRLPHRPADHRAAHRGPPGPAVVEGSGPGPQVPEGGGPQRGHLRQRRAGGPHRSPGARTGVLARGTGLAGAGGAGRRGHQRGLHPISVAANQAR
jgi:translation initiation factor IF-2